MMTPEELLATLRVRDVCRDLVTDPTTIGPDADLEQLLRAVIADTRTRHVYVVDENRRLLGSARLQAIVEALFPFAVAIDSGAGLLAPTVDVNEKKVRDLMNDRPASVREDDLLENAAILMRREGITELPVVDDDNRVIGQVNMYEIIAEFLRRRSTPQEG